MSQDGLVGCVNCHRPDRAFTDGRNLSVGIHGQIGTRNAPSLVNVGYARVMAWDGRRSLLEDQAVAPLTNPREHGLDSLDAALQRIAQDKALTRQFRVAYPGDRHPITKAHLQESLTAYLRTLNGGNSAFDRLYYGKQADALSNKAKQGFSVFMGKAGCGRCHTVTEQGALFTDYQFHRIGIGMERINPKLADLTRRVSGLSTQELDRQLFADPDIAALGRYLATKQPADIGRFRTPSLRNVALTAPYMHDGSIATLPEAVESELYYRGLETGKPLALTPLEKQTLVSFMESLTGCVPE